jgi:Uma2 family endonuclease
MALPATIEKPVKTPLTYEEYLRLPETRQRYEIIDGEMILSPSSTSDHQWMLSELYDRIKSFVREKQPGPV